MTELAIAGEVDKPRRLGRRGWAALAAVVLLPIAALWVTVATSPDENIVLSRNQVVVSAADGSRSWRGTFWNHSDSLYTDLDAVILFLDSEGRPVGQARGAARRLDPGEVFHLAAPLPRDAARIQMYQLRWTTGGSSVVLGPWRAWPFGYVQDSECGEIGLRIGACTPAREMR